MGKKGIIGVASCSNLGALIGKCQNLERNTKLTEAIGEYEEPTEAGRDFVVGIVDFSTFDAHGTTLTVKKWLQNLGQQALCDKKPGEKYILKGHVLFRAKNEEGKMHFYGGVFTVHISKKEIYFKVTGVYNERRFRKEYQKKLDKINKQK